MEVSKFPKYFESLRNAAFKSVDETMLLKVLSNRRPLSSATAIQVEEPGRHGVWWGLGQRLREIKFVMGCVVEFGRVTWSSGGNVGHPSLKL
ncbi:hypothetical protein OGAPHI_007261 [Ogataea philodendri]|uniref:Uncharacterized protein n=1 Tax=Ogataea philodendri TaxID=1378263 RepID=A0A9P8NVL7_9ASCO|nr:uncharacterized protein OGAPHI_007261 [Ogataea philodendri]KAH3660056.1 hypothetical protein OGAPHI_007261 [Ogataea philodendri]